jgi:hypothetical protein
MVDDVGWITRRWRDENLILTRSGLVETKWREREDFGTEDMRVEVAGRDIVRRK